MAEAELSAADFAYVSRLVYEHTGVDMPQGKEYLVMARLAPVAKAAELASVAELINEVRRGNIALRDDAIDEMTTKETFFFRDVHPFSALRKQVVPQLAGRVGLRPLAMWSAAAATGQEAYSLAIMMTEYFPHLTPPHILATDFSKRALARARTGEYRQLEVNRGLPASMLVKYFTQDGRDWVLNPKVRQLVRFNWLNLITDFPSMNPQDLILLRNVLTYFDIPTRTAVLNRIARVLHPDGFLLLGATESTYGMSDEFEMVKVDKTVMYQLRKPPGG